MGGFSSKTQEDLKIYLQRDYDIASYPLIVDKINKKKVFVHQITTDSRQQAQRIRRDVNLYKHLGCKSINKILQYVPLQSSKICSEQEYHYILQARDQNYDLKEQFFARKYYKEGFSTRQIINIIKTYLCALQVFHKQFHRNFRGNISLDSIVIDQTHSYQLYMTDPLLKTSYLDCNLQTLSNNSPSRSIDQKSLTFEPPQRSQQRKSRFNQTQVKLNQLFADIYVIGVIALQLYKMDIYDKKQTHQTLHNQIQNIRDQELKMLLNVMIAYKPDERGKVYEILKVSCEEAYCLQISYRKGKSSKNESKAINISQNSIGGMRKELYGKQNGYSFGGSFDRKQIPQRLGVIDNRDRKDLNGFLVNDYTKQNSKDKLGGTKCQIKTQNYFQSFPLKFKAKQTISNMSTERTFNPALNTSRSNPKPIVLFNQSNSISPLPVFSKSTKDNTNLCLNKNKSQIQNKYTLPFTQPQSQVHNPSYFSYFSKTDSILNRQTVTFRPNSFLFTEENKLPIKTTQQSPFKKHQNTSPISHYQQSQQKMEQKNLSVQNEYLEKVTNFSPSPNTFKSNKKVEQQIKDLLKQPPSNQNLISNGATPLSHISNLSPIPQQTNASSNNFVQSYQVNTFTLRQKSIVQTSSSAVGENLPIYRPNKEVQEILKRLGIGSLLYGEEEKKDSQKNINIPQNDKKQEPSHLQSFDSTVHKGTYKINLPSKPQTDLNPTPTIDSQQQQSQPSVNQATPVRQPKKLKFNSTIVQVGDDDSQYSESVKNNQQNPIDLSQHEYVVQEYETGSRYEGYKLNGERDGEGKFYYQDGGYYEGQWRANKMHGWGKLYYEGGKLAYQGNWSQDEFHGFGKVYNDNPIQLQCGFDFTNFDFLQDYWEYYEGMLVKDTKEGRGKIMLTNCEMFEGDFHNDRIQGFGKFFMKDGTVIEGIWRDSKLIKIIS